MSTNMRALIDSDAYFNFVRDYYRMFSHDTDFSGSNILIEPAKIARFSTRSVDVLLRELIRHGRNQEKDFVIVTHGNQNGLPIRIKSTNPATLQHTIMDALSDCLSNDQVAQASGRQTALLYQAGGQRVFANTAELDALLALLRQVRQLRLRHLEFRGCNLGAGRGLRAIHKLLGANYTAAPTVRHVAYSFPTARQGTVSEAQFMRAMRQLPAPRRAFTRAECFGGGNRTTAADIVVAISIANNRLDLLARDRASLMGWTQSFLQDLTLFAMGQRPSGGGYQAGGLLPVFTLETLRHTKPFVLPGESDYSTFLAAERVPVTPAAFLVP